MRVKRMCASHVRFGGCCISERWREDIDKERIGRRRERDKEEEEEGKKCPEKKKKTRRKNSGRQTKASHFRGDQRLATVDGGGGRTVGEGELRRFTLAAKSRLIVRERG